MAEEYVKGRLPQESNPTPGRYPGFVASHDTTGSEDYRPTSPDNPLPTSNYIQRESGVWVPISKDNPMPTQLTGSKVEYVRKSTDPRPEGKANDSLFLWDTRQLLLHDGTDWRDV